MKKKKNKSSVPWPSDRTRRGPYPTQVAMANRLMKNASLPNSSLEGD